MRKTPGKTIRYHPAFKKRESAQVRHNGAGRKNTRQAKNFSDPKILLALF